MILETEEHRGQTGYDVSPISVTSFDEALHQLESDLGLNDGAIDLDNGYYTQDVRRADQQPDGIYGPVASNFSAYRSPRRINGWRIEQVSDMPMRRQPPVFSEIQPLFHSNSQQLKRSRISVDGANLEKMSDSVHPVATTLSRSTRHSSAPTEYQNSSPGSISLQRSKLANFNRRAPQRLQRRRLSERTISPVSDLSPQTPNNFHHHPLSLKASPQQLPRLVIPISKRPPVEVAIEDAPPVPELALDDPSSSPVQDYLVMDAPVIKEEDATSEIIDLDSAVNGTEVSIQHLTPSIEATSNIPPLRMPTIKEPKIVSSPIDTEGFFTISDYYTNDSPFETDIYFDSPLGFLSRKDSYVNYPQDDQISLNEAEMGLRDYVKEILRRSDSQRRTTNIWSRRSSNTSKGSHLSTSTNQSSLPSTPGLVGGGLKSQVEERNPSPYYRACHVCGELFDIANYHSNPTAHCRHDPHTCPSCLSSWIRTKIESVGHQHIKCPDPTCRFMLTAQDVHAIANPEIIRL